MQETDMVQEGNVNETHFSGPGGCPRQKGYQARRWYTGQN